MGTSELDAGTRETGVLGAISRYRKNLLSLLILGGMWASIALVTPDWLGNGLFSLGAVVLGSDYRLVDYVVPGNLYERINADHDLATLIAAWFTVRDEAVDAIEMNYRARRLLETGNGKLDLSQWGERNCRATVADQGESLAEGLPFWLCVESPVGEDEALEYHLRLGSVELTRVSETDGDAAIAFFEVTDWLTDFADDPEHQRLQECQDAFRAGSEDIDPFLKVKRSTELRALSLSEWETLYREFCVPDELS